MARPFRIARGARGAVAPLQRGFAAPSNVTPTYFNRDAYEMAMAERALSQHPSWTLDSVTHAAYQAAYPAGPDFPDFYASDEVDWVMAWVRIRDWVDTLRYGPEQGVQPAFAEVAPYPDPQPLMSLGVPIERGGDANPVWPVETTFPNGCQVNYLDQDGVLHGLPFQRFGAPRGPLPGQQWVKSPSRYHIGHDCLANTGDIAVAPEDATVGNIRNFYSGTKAMYLWTDSGLTLNLGEIAPRSNKEFGVKVGDRVEKGQPVARVGQFNVGSELPYMMIHFEIFTGHRDRSLNWYDGQPRPPSLRNPTDYLLRAACSLVAAPLGFAAESLEEIKTASRYVAASPDPQMKH